MGNGLFYRRWNWLYRLQLLGSSGADCQALTWPRCCLLCEIQQYFFDGFSIPTKFAPLFAVGYAKTQEFSNIGSQHSQTMLYYANRQLSLQIKHNFFRMSRSVQNHDTRLRSVRQAKGQKGLEKLRMFVYNWRCCRFALSSDLDIPSLV